MAPRKKKKPAPKKKVASKKPGRTKTAKKRKPKASAGPKKRAVAPKPPVASLKPPNATPYRPSLSHPAIATPPRPPSVEPVGEGLIPPALLETAEGRERALDALGKWFVGAMLAAVDDAVARETMDVAISTFYDIREAAGRGRGEAAGHFFMIDAVGLEAAHRPIPWEVLARAAGPESLARWEELFEAALTETV